MSDLSNSGGLARRKSAEKVAGLQPPPAPAHPGFSGRRAWPWAQAGEGASLSPCSVASRSPGLVSEEASARGMREAQILEDQGLRPNTEVDTSYPPRSGQGPLKGRVDLWEAWKCGP